MTSPAVSAAVVVHLRNDPRNAEVILLLKFEHSHMLIMVPTVRESQGILSESGKVRENRVGQGKVREF